MSSITYNAPTETGIHLTRRDDHFVIALTVRNPTDEPLHLDTADGALFQPKMVERTFTEDGTQTVWTISAGAVQAVTRWKLPPGGRVTSHYAVPNHDMARDKVFDWLEEGALGLPEEERQDILSGHAPESLIESIIDRNGAFQYVEPDEVGVVRVSSQFPQSGDYSARLTRQYDLRVRPERALDDNLPDACNDIERYP